MEGMGKEEGEERMCAVGIFNYFRLWRGFCHLRHRPSFFFRRSTVVCSASVSGGKPQLSKDVIVKTRRWSRDRFLGGKLRSCSWSSIPGFNLTLSVLVFTSYLKVRSPHVCLHNEHARLHETYANCYK